MRNATVLLLISMLAACDVDAPTDADDETGESIPDLPESAPDIGLAPALPEQAPVDCNPGGCCPDGGGTCWPSKAGSCPDGFHYKSCGGACFDVDFCIFFGPVSDSGFTRKCCG
jgi:hypothetical protein